MAGRVGAEAVLFRVAGGASVGFGHVMRALALARALGVTPRVSVRGGQHARVVAASRGAVLDTCARASDLRSAGIQLLVLDDPSAVAARPWVAAARRLGTPSVSVHDLGLAPVDSDLAVDGSLWQPRREWPSRRVLTGAAFAVLDPEIARLRARRRRVRLPRRVVVALGGGSTGRAALALAGALQRALPASAVVVAPGFIAQIRGKARGVQRIAPGEFRRELARSSVAVVGGGVSLSEACALGIAAVGVAVVPGQASTVRAFVRRGIALDGGRLSGTSPAEMARLARRVARQVARMLDDEAARASLTRKAMAAIDARGAERVADAARGLMDIGSRPLRQLR